MHKLVASDAHLWVLLLCVLLQSSQQLHTTIAVLKQKQTLLFLWTYRPTEIYNFILVLAKIWRCKLKKKSCSYFYKKQLKPCCYFFFWKKYNFIFITNYVWKLIIYYSYTKKQINMHFRGFKNCIPNKLNCFNLGSSIIWGLLIYLMFCI